MLSSVLSKPSCARLAGVLAADLQACLGDHEQRDAWSGNACSWDLHIMNEHDSQEATLSACQTAFLWVVCNVTYRKRRIRTSVVGNSVSLGDVLCLLSAPNSCQFSSFLVLKGL